MISINVNIAGNKKGSVKLARFTREMAPNLIRGIDKATAILEREVKRQLSLGGTIDRRKDAMPTKNLGKHLRKGDGTLQTSWTLKPAKRVPGGVEGHVSSWVPYSAIHEFGGTTAAHVIKPRNAKALRFFVGGEAVFARSVNHPGSKIPARPYVQPAIDKKREAMVDVVAREITRPLQ